MVPTVEASLPLVVFGLVLAAFGVHQLGTVRAALKWPSARRPRVGRGVAGTEIALGLLLITAGLVLASTLIPVNTPLRVAIGAGVGLVVLVSGLVICLKATDRVELNALIGTPSPLYRATGPASGGSHQTATAPTPSTTPVVVTVPVPEGPDPSVPVDARAGWAYQDEAGEWYLAVGGGGGFRLIRLTDFQIVPPDTARGLEMAGIVELSVLPPTPPGGTLGSGATPEGAGAG